MTHFPRKQNQNSNFWFLTVGTLCCSMIGVYLLFFAPQQFSSPSESSSSSKKSNAKNSEHSEITKLIEITDDEQQKNIQNKVRNLRINKKENLKPDNLMTISTSRLNDGVKFGDIDGTKNGLLEIKDDSDNNNNNNNNVQIKTRFQKKENEEDMIENAVPKTSNKVVATNGQQTKSNPDDDDNNTNNNNNNTNTNEEISTSDKQQPLPKLSNETSVSTAADGSTKITLPPPSPVSTPQVPSSRPRTSPPSPKIPKIDHFKDNLPHYDKSMRRNIRKGIKILQDLDPLPVVETNNNRKVETITDEVVMAWTKPNYKVKPSDTAETNHADRVKFVQTVSGMMELFSTADKTQQQEEPSSNSSSSSPVLLAARTTHYMYARPWLRWKLNNVTTPAPSARYACLYAGFTRDFELMLRTCTKTVKRCMNKKIRRTFGYQIDRIIQPLDCDVFMSSWDLHGAGRYFTTSYERVLIKPTWVWQQKLREKLAAIHVHNYEPYGELWNASHRFPRKFPQIRAAHETKQETLARAADQTKMFNYAPNHNKYMRMNDYSQSFKHYCSALLTFSYETWAKGSYDIYLRLRTDLRAVRQIMPSSSIVMNNNKKNNKNTKRNDLDEKENDDADNIKQRLKRSALLELCPAAKYGKGVNIASVAGAKSINKDDEKESENNTDDQKQENTVNKAPAIISSKSVVETEKHSCENHYLTAATSLAHIQDGTNALARNFDSTFFSIYQKGNVSTSLQTVGINSFDIADFAYIGSPEIISYLGGHMWALCTQPSTSPSKPSFYPLIVNEFQNTGEFTFSEYNLMMWRMILDGGYARDTLYYLVRVSRASMPLVTSKK